MKRIAIAFVAIGITLVSCNKNNKVTPVCDGSEPTYDGYVKDIITPNCAGCHTGMASYTGLSGYLSSGEFEDQVLKKQRMPKSGPLDEATLNKLQCWVENGFPEN